MLVPLQAASAQDYPAFPVLDYEFTHLDAELSLSVAERSLSGTVSYSMKSKNGDAGHILLMANGLQIDSVAIDGAAAEFQYEGNELLITPPQQLIDTNRAFSLSISYSTGSDQVFLQTSAGTLFTSLAPLRRAEWIPIYEHPRVEMTTRIAMEVPAALEFVTNGFFDTQRSLDADRKQVVWKSDVPIPSTDLAFFAGRLEFAETMSGAKSVRVYSEPNTINGDLRNELLRETSTGLNSLQRQLRYELPYEAFSAVVLQDHKWEPKPYGASLGVLSMNAYGLKQQLDRVLAAQWFGAYHRSETVEQSGAQLIMQAAVLGQPDPEIQKGPVMDYPHASEFTAYDGFNLENWLKWRQLFTNLPAIQRNAITDNKQRLMRLDRKVNNWQDYMNLWYEQTGRPIEQVAISSFGTESTEQAKKLVNIAFEPDRERSRINVIVEPREALERDSLYVPLKLVSRQGTRTKNMVVYRTGGEFYVEYEQTPANITIDYSKVDGIEFIEMKSLDMWLHQLRDDENPQNRKRAAEMMPRFRDDPDIQLAMQDYLRREDQSEVRTAMIRALSDIVEGSSGTQQIFIEMARNAQGEELHAAIDALWHYKGNEDVVSTVGRVAQQSANIPAAVSAIGVFRQVASTEQFNELARSVLLGSRPAGVRAAMVEELYRADDQDVAIFTSMDVLESNDFPYAMRNRALSMLIRYERSEELREVLPALVADNDPRIRYQALAHLNKLSANMMNDLLESRYELERDPRVRSAFDEFY